MIAAAVTDENRFRYDLNSLSWKYNGYGKSEAGLAEAAAQWGIDPKSEMYKLPSLNVGLMLNVMRKLRLVYGKR